MRDGCGEQNESLPITQDYFPTTPAGFLAQNLDLVAESVDSRDE